MGPRSGETRQQEVALPPWQSKLMEVQRILDDPQSTSKGLHSTYTLYNSLGVINGVSVVLVDVSIDKKGQLVAS